MSGEKPDVWAGLRALRDGQYPELRSLLVMTLLEFAGFSMLIPIIPFFAIEELGLRPREVGIVFTSMSLAQLVGGYLFGRCSDAFGRRPIIIFGFAWAALGFGLTSIAQGFWDLLIIRSLQGFSGGTMALCISFILDVVTVDERPVYIGLFQGVTGSAFIFGPGLGGLLVSVGVPRRGIFVLSGILSLLATIYGYFTLQESLAPAKRRPFTLQPGESSSADWAAVNAGLSLTWLARFFAAAASGFLFVTYAFLIKDLFGWTDVHFAAVLVSAGLGGCLMQLFVFPPVAARLGGAKTLALGTAFGVAAYVCYPEPILAIHFAGMACYCCSSGLIEPAIPILVAIFASGRHLGFANGVAVSARALATAITPVIATTLYEVSPRTCYHAGAGIFGCGVLTSCALTFAAPLEKDDETQPIKSA